MLPMAGWQGEGLVRFLEGRVLLVTRPREQTDALVRAIEAAGGKAQLLPTLEIGGVTDSPALDDALRALQAYDIVVFVSANAVREALARCGVLGVSGIGAIQMAAAPGPATGAALREAGVARVIVPAERFDSEGLIAELNARGAQFTRALILRGMDDENAGSAGTGREELVRWLRARGATVDVLACYRRVWAQLAPSTLAALTAHPAPDATLVTSSEGGRALAAMLGQPGLAWLAQAPVFAPHPRIAETMTGLGFASVHVTEGGDAGLMHGLAVHFGGAANA